ncbi:MAG: YybS family protein [Nitrospinaceae bacterium]
MPDPAEPKDFILPVVLFLVLFAVILVMPGLGIFVGVLAPSPLIIVYLQRGNRVGLALLALVFLSLLALMGPRQAVLFFAEYAVLAIIMAETIRQRLDFDKCIFFGALGPALLSIFFSFVLVSDDGKSVTDVFQEQIETQYQKSMEILKGAGDAKTDALPPPDEKVFRTFAQAYPALITVGSLITAALNFALVRFFWIRFYGPSLFSGRKFSEWILPDQMIWALILSGTAVYLTDAPPGVIGMNVLIVVGMIYFFQGLAIIKHFLEARKVPAFFQVLLLLLIFIQPLLIGLVVGLGVFDLWVDFRKLKAPPETPPADP